MGRSARTVLDLLRGLGFIYKRFEVIIFLIFFINSVECSETTKNMPKLESDRMSIVGLIS